MKSLKYIFVIFSFYTLMYCVHSEEIGKCYPNQTGALSGKITDLKTGKNLSGAKVILPVALLTFRTITDNKGNFKITGIPPGINYNVTISKNGYKSSTFAFSISAGKTKPCKYSLSSTYLELLSPNGGESIFAGSEMPIRWISVGIKRIRIDFSINGGLDWMPLEEKVDASRGFYIWDVQDIPSTRYRIRISDIGESGLMDISDRAFKSSSI